MRTGKKYVTSLELTNKFYLNENGMKLNAVSCINSTHQKLDESDACRKV